LFVELIREQVSSSTSDADRADWAQVLEVMSAGVQCGDEAGDHDDMTDVQLGVRLVEGVRQRREAAELLQSSEQARLRPQLLAAARQVALAKWPQKRAELEARWAVPEMPDINDPKYSSDRMLAMRAATDGSDAVISNVSG
jgi:hypothetical protein